MDKSYKTAVEPGYSGTARPCPACMDGPVVGAFVRVTDPDCQTCFGTGVVHPGISCPYCGRSVQFYGPGKDKLICGSVFCLSMAEADLKKGDKPPDPVYETEEDEIGAWRNAFGWTGL